MKKNKKSPDHVKKQIYQKQVFDYYYQNIVKSIEQLIEQANPKSKKQLSPKIGISNRFDGKSRNRNQFVSKEVS